MQKTLTGGKVAVGVVIAVCFLVTALEGYDIQAFGVAAPKLAPQLHLGAGQMGWAGSAAMIGLVFGALWGGWLADRIGRKPVLMVSILTFGVFSVATAMTNSYETLLLARALTGLGLGGAMPNLVAIAADIAPANRRGATMSAIFCGMPTGGAIVALISRSAQHLDWRNLFLVGGVLPLLLAPIVARFLPETRPVHDPAADRRLLYALFGGGRAVATLLLWTTYALTLIILYLLLNWLPTLVVAKHLTPADGATASLAFNVLAIPGALLLGFAADRVGYRWSLAAAYLVLAVSTYVLGASSSLGVVVAFSGLAGFTVIGAQYVMYGLAPMLYAPQVRAAGSGAAVGIGRIGSIIGPLLAGQLRQMGWSADQVIGAMVPIALAAGVAAFVLSYLAKAHASHSA